MAHALRKEHMTTAVAEVCFSTDALADEIGVLPHVKKILVAQDGERISVWTVVDDFSRSVRDAVYEAQARLIDNYHRFVRFDFHVIPGDQTTEISRAYPLPIGR